MSTNDKNQNLTNLASPKIGTKIIEVSDDFFGKASRMLNDKDPVFIEDKYDEHGKWMDGWESKRRRVGGNDWAIIELGSPGIISEVDIDTSFFTGNFPPFASIEGLYSDQEPDENSDWITILSKSSLKGDASNKFKIQSTAKVNYIRLQIYPDGGVARLRLFGEVKLNWDFYNNNKNNLIELSSLKLGGSIVAYNNAHYGDVSALLSDGRGKTMGDGWETRRRREPGHDWIIIKLATKGLIKKIEIDTAHFKGNYPDQASIQISNFDEEKDLEEIINVSQNWKYILNKTKLQADKIHNYEIDEKLTQEVTHVRLNIYPDGGVSRLRIFGLKL
ncbi:allantoicase [Alphaproteobacteria bacterium]|jgi:allantoicase|nr:allantoicase [Alphaproteobacteria bacterium]